MQTTTCHFLQIADVIKLISRSRSWVYARLDRNASTFDRTFPRPVKLSPGRTGSVAWVAEELYAWMAHRMRNRDASFLPEDQPRRDIAVQSHSSHLT